MEQFSVFLFIFVGLLLSMPTRVKWQMARQHWMHQTPEKRLSHPNSWTATRDTGRARPPPHPPLRPPLQGLRLPSARLHHERTLLPEDEQERAGCPVHCRNRAVDRLRKEHDSDPATQQLFAQHSAEVQLVRRRVSPCQKVC